MSKSAQMQRAYWRVRNPWRKTAFLRKPDKGTWGSIIAAAIKSVYRYEPDARKRRRLARRGLS
jgi:hypothetical protein